MMLLTGLCLLAGGVCYLGYCLERERARMR